MPTLLASLSDPTTKQYSTALRSWWSFCKLNQVSLSPPPNRLSLGDKTLIRIPDRLKTSAPGRQPLFYFSHFSNHENTSARNVITEHRLQKEHDFDWDSVAILDEEPHYRKRLISKMIFIRRQTHRLNL
ncbi:hypothetical protein ALC57_17657 [Trachymyrmex cornetzi]|uniref:Uncharacterized protein n=1 Tax=Trachymyrmex cornetzi TaxID=471704 RepID=A0A151ITC3_9HYME|nr:hypothetical protein ALC57_17657 [Trachymyrmex cornetzi]